ncbi:MAG: hypothetical protein EOP19_04785 [Hyphomicrobiales bacterium]|nr:MAG: hypothetical protein EOP19_04785 [Hyphomicrobiales bacterium]
MRAVLTIALAAALLAPPAVGQEAERRPVGASAAYWTCSRQAASMASERTCLSDELARVRWALRQAEESSRDDPESVALWQRSADHDCAKEGELAGSGNSAGDSETACWIERTTERLAYVRRFGNW